MPATGTIGTAARRFFYGPGMANLDVALLKTLRLSETSAVDLRFEAFDVLDQAQFFGAAAVNGNVGSPGFGQIVSAAAPRVVQIALKFSF